MNDTIVDPIGKFYLESTEDDGQEHVKGIIELFGEDGTRTVIHFTDPKQTLSIGMLFISCSKDLKEAIDIGIDFVIEKQNQDLFDPTVEDFLD